MGPRPPATALVTAVVAHRGAHHGVRENTLAAMAAALALGVDGVEFDVRPSADGALVVHHDPVLGGRAVSHTPRADLPGWVPTLAEVLEATRSVTAHVEVKNSRDPGEVVYDGSGALVAAVLGEIAAAGLERTPVVSCFDLATCARVRAAGAPVRVAWLVEGGALEGALTRAHVLELDAVNPHWRAVDAAGAARARELGLELNVWTVNRARDLEAMVELGVASVITDEPARALALVAGGRTRR